MSRKSPPALMLSANPLPPSGWVASEGPACGVTRPSMYAGAEAWRWASRSGTSLSCGSADSHPLCADVGLSRWRPRNQLIRWSCPPIGRHRSRVLEVGLVAARHDAVNMGMMGEGLPPCVQDRDHAGLGAEIFWVGSDDADRLGGRLEQDVVEWRHVHSASSKTGR